MSQLDSVLKGQVFRIALWGCSLNVFVCVNVFVFVFVSFVGQVISLHLSDQMSLENLFLKAFSKCICLCLSVGQFVSPMTHSDHTSQRSHVSTIAKCVCLCLFVSLIPSSLWSNVSRSEVSLKMDNVLCLFQNQKVTHWVTEY